MSRSEWKCRILENLLLFLENLLLHTGHVIAPNRFLSCHLSWCLFLKFTHCNYIRNTSHLRARQEPSHNRRGRYESSSQSMQQNGSDDRRPMPRARSAPIALSLSIRLLHPPNDNSQRHPITEHNLIIFDHLPHTIIQPQFSHQNPRPISPTSRLPLPPYPPPPQALAPRRPRHDLLPSRHHPPPPHPLLNPRALDHQISFRLSNLRPHRKPRRAPISPPIFPLLELPTFPPRLRPRLVSLPPPHLPTREPPPRENKTLVDPPESDPPTRPRCRRRIPARSLSHRCQQTPRGTGNTVAHAQSRAVGSEFRLDVGHD